MRARAENNEATGGGLSAAARRVLFVAALGLAAVLVGVVLGAAVIPVPSFLEGLLPSLGFGTDASGAFVSWDAEQAPEYYRELGPAQIDWTLEPGDAEYGALDSLGRATFARACVTPELAAAGAARERGSLQGLEPTGWGENAEVSIPLANGDVYHGYLWNRSHLLAKSLGGSDGLRNLITGTRMQNVGTNSSGGGSGGMAYCEKLARDWLAEHGDGWVLYAATPVYAGEELVCRSVMVDLLSSDGSLDARIEVYNAAQGIEINYATGEFRQAEAVPSAVPTSSEVVVDATAAADAAARDYVVNTNTNKFHAPDCPSVSQMSDRNRQDVHTTRDDLISQGFEPCGSCQP